MKPQHDFVAERALANHCAELVPAALPQRDLLADGAAIAQNIAAQLAHTMLSVASGKAISITCGEPSRTNTTAFMNRMGREMAHSIMGMESGPVLLLSIDHTAIHRLTDRAYGGAGEVADPLPRELPMSADLTLRQMETSWCDALGLTFPHCAPFANLRRGADLGRLDPFCGQAECVQFALTVAQEGHTEWTIVLAASPRDLARLAECHLARDLEKSAPTQPGDPLAEPFGDIALPARAVLATRSISLAQASALAVGDAIPLSIARDVPILIGDTAIARGSIGTQDDCVALQITNVS